MTRLFTENKEIKLDVYNVFKYTAKKEDLINCITVNYENVVGFEIATGESASRIEEETDAASIDEAHEYLILHFDDGRTATFRNSYVDMFLR